MLPTMLLLGIGFGLCFAAINTQATAGVADAEQGLASGLVNTSLQIGGAIVLAVVTAILGTGTETRGHMLPGTHTAIAVIIGVSGAAMIATVIHLYQTRTAVARRTARVETTQDEVAVEFVEEFVGVPAETCEVGA
jgi:sugar phosphate permease